jgi:hypothetical protein
MRRTRNSYIKVIGIIEREKANGNLDIEEGQY